MAWWIQPREIMGKDGKPTGRWRMVAESDEDGGSPPMCSCRDGHASELLAKCCEEARRRATEFGGTVRIARHL